MAEGVSFQFVDGAACMICYINVGKMRSCVSGSLLLAAFPHNHNYLKNAVTGLPSQYHGPMCVKERSSLFYQLFYFQP